MPYLLIKHKVEDFDTFKPVYDEHAALRKAGGSIGAHMLRNADDPNEIVILLHWDDMENARRFAQSDDLRQAMQQAGVSGKPDVYFLEEVERTSV
jgi:heme-degrading monooxygenase HmoA